MTTIYSRATWGARYADGDAPAALPAAEVWLHHSATPPPPPDATFDQDAAAVRALEQIGQDRFGSGISYTFLIPPSGRIFQGHSVSRRGTHTGGRNGISRAICLIGDYEVARPSPAQIGAVAELLAYGHGMGWWRAPVLTGGHRDVKQTACPGRFAYALIPVINSRAQNQEVNYMLPPTLPDFYAEGLPPQPTDVLLAWGVAHAAHARDRATEARDVAEQVRDGLVRGVEMLREEIRAIQAGAIDYSALAAALVTELLSRTADRAAS